MLVFLSFSIHNEYIGKSSDTYFCDGNNKIHHFFKLSFLNSSNQFLFPITHNLIDQEISANVLTQGPLPIKTQILDNTSHNHASKYLHGPTTLQKLRDFDIISFHRNSQKQDVSNLGERIPSQISVLYCYLLVFLLHPIVPKSIAHKSQVK